MPSTKNNHYSIKLNKEGLSYINLGKPIFSKNTLLEESINACKEIKNYHANDTLYLCLSGGIDSHCMLLSFLNSKVPFKVCIFYFYNGQKLLNQHETSIAENICTNYNIDYVKIETDVIKFFHENNYLRYLNDEIYCTQPVCLLHMECLNKIDGVPIYNGQIPGFVNKLNLHDYFYQELRRPSRMFSYNLYPSMTTHSTEEFLHKAIYMRASKVNEDHAFYRYMKLRGGGIFQFFFWSPELIGSALRLNTYKQIYSNTAPWCYEVKCQAYKEGGFEIVPRNIGKQHGFEFVEQEYDSLYGENSFFNSYHKFFRNTYPLTHNHNLIDFIYYLQNGLTTHDSY